MLAAMVVATSTAFAQDVKSVLKSKDYAEAKSQLDACLSSLNNEEKAKAKSEIADLINKAADKITNTKSDEKLYDDFLKEMK